MRHGWIAPGCALLVVLAAAAPSAEAEPGGGGRIVYARMHGRTLVLRGAPGKTVDVTVTATRSGARVTSDYLNGSRKPLLFRRPPRRIVLDMRAATVGRLILRQTENAKPWPLRRIHLWGSGRFDRLTCEGIETRGTLDIRAKRSPDIDVRFQDCAIGGGIDVRVEDDTQSNIQLANTTVDGPVSLHTKDGSDSTQSVVDEERLAELDVIESVVGGVSVDLPAMRHRTYLLDSEATGDVTLAGVVGLTATRTSVSGEIDVQSVGTSTTSPALALRFGDCEVRGPTRVLTNDSDTSIWIARCDLRSLEIVTGAGDDELETESVTIEEAALFDGGDGASDRWIFDDDSVLETRNVEEFGPPPAD